MRLFGSVVVFLAVSGSAPAQSLQVVDPIVSQFEDGPALSGQKMVPGEIVFVRFAAVNFKTSEDGKLRLTAHAQIFDPRGTPIAHKDEQALDTSLRDEDKQFRPRFHFQFQLPSIAPPGTWRVHFDVTDNQTGQQNDGYTGFAVAGTGVEPAAELTIRDLAFYRGQEEEAPLRLPAYRAGDTVWVRFNITGYKYGEQNAIDVAYDVAVSAADGKRLFTQESAAVERSQAFYPQPWVPGTFSLTLQPTMHAGTYTVMVTAHDGVGKSDAAAQAQFKVE